MKSKLPIKRLSEIAEIQMGQSPKGSSYNTSGEGVPLINGPVEFGRTPFSRTKRTKFTTEPTKICRVGDLILCVRGSTTGRMNIAGYDSCIGRGVASIRSEKYQEWVNFFIHANRETIYRLGTGATFPNVSGLMLAKLEIPIPTLSEQKRIVSIVDEAFEAIDIAIDNTKQNLTNARELFESYLNSRLFNVVSGEATQTLLCITDLIIDCEHKTAPVQEEGIPSIRTPNIGKGHLIFDGVYRVSEETYEFWTRRGKPESGDLILAREAPAGNVGVVPPGAKVCLGQRTVLIRPNKKIIDSHYLAFLLLHPIVQKRLLDKSTGATVQHVNMKDIRGLSMSELPSIQVQKACVEELEHFKSEVNRLEKIYQGKLTALNELKQSILHKAFTGELTVDKADLKTNIEQEAIAV
jgi:type I restriction enzyme, S subunit